MEEQLIIDYSIDMKRRFDAMLNELCTSKGQNTQILTRQQYLELIEKVRASRSKAMKKRPEDYQRLRRFDVVTVDEEERLIVPVEEGTEQIKFYVHVEETFQHLHNVHISTGHGGRNRMEKEIRLKYKNITRQMIVIYLSLCVTCEKYHKVPKNCLVRQTTSKNTISRCQVDLINMQSQPDDRYKYILVYQDHSTKFVQLRSLTSKRPEEVARVLLDIFTIFGAPAILQSDNGREFASNVAKLLSGMWPELKMACGKAGQPHSQNSTDRQDVGNLLGSWMEDNNSRKWSEGLPFVQLKKNRAYHSGVKCSPYEAMFGRKLNVGLRSCLPEDVVSGVNCEEDLEEIFQGQESNCPQELSSSQHNIEQVSSFDVKPEWRAETRTSEDSDDSLEHQNVKKRKTDK